MTLVLLTLSLYHLGGGASSKLGSSGSSPDQDSAELMNGSYALFAPCLFVSSMVYESSSLIPLFNSVRNPDGSMEVLGTGAYGKVFLIEDRRSHLKDSLFRRYALKVISPPQDEPSMNSALGEAKILLKWNHPNVISCVDVFLRLREKDDIKICIVMELCRCDLVRYLVERRGSLNHEVRPSVL